MRPSRTQRPVPFSILIVPSGRKSSQFVKRKTRPESDPTLRAQSAALRQEMAVAAAG